MELLVKYFFVKVNKQKMLILIFLPTSEHMYLVKWLLDKTKHTKKNEFQMTEHENCVLLFKEKKKNLKYMANTFAYVLYYVNIFPNESESQVVCCHYALLFSHAHQKPVI